MLRENRLCIHHIKTVNYQDYYKRNYVKNMKAYQHSSNAYIEAVHLIPRGVNSPVRAAFKSLGLPPIFMESGKGSRDIDGNEHIDYVLSRSPLILGHADERIVKKLTRSTD